VPGDSSSFGDITVSGGTRVAADALRTAHTMLAAAGSTFGGLADALHPVLVAGGATDAARLAHVAAEGIHDAASRAKRLATEVLEAADGYEHAERDTDSRIMDLSTLAGWAFGRLIPWASILGALSLPELLAVAVPGFIVGSVVAGSPGAFLRDVVRVAGSKVNVLRDPRIVALLRFAVSAADDAMLGAAGLPLHTTAELDDRGTGWFGLRGGARVVVGAGHLLGLLDDSPVRVRRVDAGVAEPPATFADLAARIPPSTTDGPQVRVERYTDAGGAKPTYVVYVGGTVDTSPKATDEPFDITSDLAGVAQLDPASVRATEQAMHDAGIAAGDTVIPVGYSQGGIVATALATSGRYETPALVTFGSPTAGIDVAPGTVDVAVEHTDDLVPALGGIPRAGDEHGGDRILVTRQTFDGPVPPQGSPIAAHRMSEYSITAQQMDAAGDQRLTAALAALPTGNTGTAGLYRAQRIHPAAATEQPQCAP
jgi:hypothetical protein